MEVIRAEVLGFCMGVRRAVEIAAEQARRGSPVFTIGPLVHNPRVLDELKAIGVQALAELMPQNIEPAAGLQANAVSAYDCNPENCSFIIRAHGISPAAEANLRGRGYRIIDATCPNVKLNQLKTQELSRAGYCLFLAGEARHAEIEGILGYAETPFCAVVGSACEAEKAAAELKKTNKEAKTALLGQTTICEEEYANIAGVIKKYFSNLVVICTICHETTARQHSLRALLGKSDAVIIAGGKESANTRRLLTIAQESGKLCALAENSSEIPEAFFSCKKIGICAGASTPDSVITEIEQKLKH